MDGGRDVAHQLVQRTQVALQPLRAPEPVHHHQHVCSMRAVMVRVLQVSLLRRNDEGAHPLLESTSRGIRLQDQWNQVLDQSSPTHHRPKEQCQHARLDLRCDCTAIHLERANLLHESHCLGVKLGDAITVCAPGLRGLRWASPVEIDAHCRGPSGLISGACALDIPGYLCVKIRRSAQQAGGREPAVVALGAPPGRLLYDG
mmetsp:Transcript_68398/g.164169  ORF Transcript_68398/g.164169 Transcript_68398/m.164169 type:complete len:202 (+) Transcript_68398:1056-1661(+)